MNGSRLIALCLLAVLLIVGPGQTRDFTPITGESAPPRTFGAPQTAVDTVTDPHIDWPVSYGLQNTGLLRATFGNNGTFGTNYVWYVPEIPGWPFVNFEVPVGSNTEHLFSGAIWIGGVVDGDTLVSTGADGWIGLREMHPDNLLGGITKLYEPGDYAMRAEFADTNTYWAGYDAEDGYRPHIPLNVNIANRSYIWRTEPADAVVLYDVVVTNIGDQMITDGYIGFNFDADICRDCSYNLGFEDDVAGSIREHGIAYIIDNDGDFNPESEVPRAFGFKLLAASIEPSDTAFNWWVSNATAPLDFGPRMKSTPDDPFRDFGTGGLGTPARDDNKYYILRHQEWDYDQVLTATLESTDPVWLQPPYPELALDVADGFDTRFLMSFGPFDLAPGQSERFIFANFTTDSIHTLATNGDNLPNNSDTYLANLDFTSLIRNAEIADSLAAILLDPGVPPAGLRVESLVDNDVTVAWDPACFSDIYGYRVVASPVDPALLPYPGVAPPWLELTTFDLSADLGPDDLSYTLADLLTDRFYLASVANLTASDTGRLAHPIAFRAAEPPPAPSFGSPYAFALAGEPVELTWFVTDLAGIDHYNIYRFDSLSAADHAYHAFYDEGAAAATIPPADFFDIDGTRYYYYGMTPHAVVPGSAASFALPADNEGTTYLITAVDAAGFESAFSAPTELIIAPPRDKDILLLTHGKFSGYLAQDTAAAFPFYDSLLAGYDYDIYDWADTNRGGIYTDWHLFMEYDLLIIDDQITDEIFQQLWERRTRAYTKYLLSGGRLAYFGSFSRMQLGGWGLIGDMEVTPISHPLLCRFFGIDSVNLVPPLHWLPEYGTGIPYTDSVYCFQRAESNSPGFPTLTYDLTQGRIRQWLLDHYLWPVNAPTGVCTFYPDSTGVVTHRFGPDPGINSVFDSLPVGIYTNTDGIETFAFGFHLWYMELPGARALVDAMFDKSAIAAAFDPDSISIAALDAIKPETLTVYLGNHLAGLSLADVQPGSIRLSEGMEPLTITEAFGVEGFNGPTLALTVLAEPFLTPFATSPGYHTVTAPIDGTRFSGEPFITYADLVVISKLLGDFTGDSKVNVADLTLAIDFLFRGGHPELSTVDLDVTGDCQGNISDLTSLINYLFRGGGPFTPCRAE